MLTNLRSLASFYSWNSLAAFFPSFEQLARPPRQPLAEAVELIQETSPITTTLLEGAVYEAFSLLTETEGVWVATLPCA